MTRRSAVGATEEGTLPSVFTAPGQFPREIPGHVRDRRETVRGTATPDHRVEAAWKIFDAYD